MIDLLQILDRLQKLPTVPFASPDVAWAIINDVFRDFGIGAVSIRDWRELAADPGNESRISYLAWMLVATGLADQFVSLRPVRQIKGPRKLIAAFLSDTSELSSEILAGNHYRREEFARKFLDAVGLPILGESEAVSRERLMKVDSGRLNKVLQEQERDRAKKKREWEEQMERARQDNRYNYE